MVKWMLIAREVQLKDIYRKFRKSALEALFAFLDKMQEKV